MWMVHSGGFYIVDKQKRPELRQQTLHWFKWEAMFTFVFGFLLLILVYYSTGAMINDDVLKLQNWQAVAISVAMLVVGWFVYDLLWISPLAKNEVAATIVSYLLIVAAIYTSAHIFAARAAYMQVGAMLDLYKAKSGDEIEAQLFSFTDK